MGSLKDTGKQVSKRRKIADGKGIKEGMNQGWRSKGFGEGPSLSLGSTMRDKCLKESIIGLLPTHRP